MGGLKNFTVGIGNETQQVCSSALGFRLKSDANFAMTIGNGSTALGGQLYNNIPYSLMIGVNSNVPTIFVSNSGGWLGSFGKVGFGNITAPMELIDANGNARFRDMPTTAGNVLITGVQEDAAGDYSLSTLGFGSAGQYLDGSGEWLDLPSSTQCDWNTVNSGQDIAMGYTSVSGACVPGNVGIGEVPPADARLYVSDIFGSSNENGILISTSGSANNQSGLNVRLTNTGPNLGGVGVRSYVLGGKELWAGKFTAIADENLTHHFAAVEGIAVNNSVLNKYPIGVYGKAENNQSQGRAIGLYGEAVAPLGMAWPAYFVGTPVNSMPSLTLSDQSLKTNVAGIENATNTLNQLKPCTYNYSTETSLADQLNGTVSIGFIAQEVQAVLPLAVQQFVHPGKWDEEGNPIFEDAELLGVKYDLFIPLLVAGFQEQQATTSAQQAQIEALTALVQNCCASGGDKSLQGSGSTSSPTPDGSEFDLQIEKASLDQNVPNPFAQETSITYRIPQQAMVRVRVMDAKGQQVDLLVDGLMPKGEYKIVWNASHLPSGLYFYTLEGDGVELVKKAVKL